MAESLDKLARRSEDNPFFLACPLRLYAQSENLDDVQLAERLRCEVEKLAHVRLCRAPIGESARFREDVDAIAAAFQLDAAVLADAVRRGQALWSMRASNTTRTLLAARDAGTADDPAPGDDA